MQHKGYIGVMMTLAVMTGCVSQEAYERQREIADHLRTVKTEQDISLSALQGEVLALKSGYKSQSAIVTGLEALARATSTELQTMQTRIGGLGTDQLQLRAELGRVSTQMTETVRLLDRVSQQQGTLETSLTTLTQRVGDLKRPSVAKPMNSTIPDMSRVLPSSTVATSPAGGIQPGQDNRTAVERAIAQRTGQGGLGTQPTTTAAESPSHSVMAHPADGQSPAGKGAVGNSQSGEGDIPVSVITQGVLKGVGDRAIPVMPPSQVLNGNGTLQPKPISVVASTQPPSAEDESPLLKKPVPPAAETKKKSDVPWWRVPVDRIGALFSSSEATAQNIATQPVKAE